MTKPSGSCTYSASSACTAAKGFCPRSGSSSGLAAAALIFLFALADLAHDLCDGEVHVHLDGLVVEVVHGLHWFSEHAIEKLLEVDVAAEASVRQNVQRVIFNRRD